MRWDTSFPEPRWWNGSPDVEPPQPSIPAYVCTVKGCQWDGGKGARAYDHHKATGHAVRGVSWPDDWPDAQFSCCRTRTCEVPPAERIDDHDTDREAFEQEMAQRGLLKRA